MIECKFKVCDLAALRRLFVVLSKKPFHRPWCICVREWKDDQSSEQRRYLESTITAAAVHFGYSSANERAAFREAIFQNIEGFEEKDLPNGDKIRVRPSTTRRTKGEMSNLITAVEQLLSEFGFYAE